MSYNFSKVCVAACCAMSFVFTGSASAKDLSLLIRVGMDTGGEKYGTLYFSDGSSKTITAGAGLQLGGGMLYQFENQPYGVEATIEYKFDSATAQNGEVSFNTTPINILGTYIAGAHHFGAGLTYQLNSKYECKIPGFCAGAINYGNTLGEVAQYTYTLELPSSKLDIGVRYNLIKYSAPGFRTRDGSGFGLVVGSSF